MLQVVLLIVQMLAKIVVYAKGLTVLKELSHPLRDL
jgi:hypothetical protein